MLILTRRQGQSLMIGKDIRVTVMGFNGQGQVRIGVDAPKDVTVDREEIAERKAVEAEIAHLMTKATEAKVAAEPMSTLSASPNIDQAVRDDLISRIPEPVVLGNMQGRGRLRPAFAQLFAQHKRDLEK